MKDLRRWFVCGFIFIMLFILAGVSYGTGVSSSHKSSLGGTITLEFDTSRLLVMQPVEAKISIVDAQNKPVNAALIFSSLYIPMYATGTNKPTIKQTNQDGVYSGIMFFNHAGVWNVDLTINYKDGAYEELSLNVEVADQTEK